MCYYWSIEDLPTLGIKSLRETLRKGGYTLGGVESALRPDSGDRVEFSLSWSKTHRLSGNTTSLGTAKIVLRRDSEGLVMDIYRGENTWSTPYRLVRRESNLLPGSYRYYISDPFSQGDSVCEKLYYLPVIGEFVPRSVLNSHRVRYSFQRKGHRDRLLSSPKGVPEERDLRYRKTHYRGKETPFWRRYRELSEDRDYKTLLFEAGEGYTAGLIPEDMERELREEYFRLCRRKGNRRRSLYTSRRGKSS